MNKPNEKQTCEGMKEITTGILLQVWGSRYVERYRFFRVTQLGYRLQEPLDADCFLEGHEPNIASL